MTGDSQRLDFTTGGHAEPEVWYPRLERLMSQQLELVEQIELIDQHKSALLEESDMERYLHALGERQPVVDRLTELNEELRPFADRFAVLAASLKDEQREHIYAQAGRLDAALATIAERDAHEASVLASKREQIARELAGLNSGKAALGAYGGHAGGPASQSHDEHV